MDVQATRRSWLCAIVLAVFDLDTGQKTEACVPEGELSSPELQAIAYGAFPVRTPDGLQTDRTVSAMYTAWPVHAGGPGVRK